MSFRLPKWPIFTRQFNPYDLNEIAEIDRIIKKYPFQRVQQKKIKSRKKHKIEWGFLNPRKEK
jgi:hypothetical protein